MAFQRGQQVRCVDASAPWYLLWVRRLILREPWPLVRGEVYHVERAGLLIKGVPAIVLFEVKNLAALAGAFRANRFRPLVTKKDAAFWTEGAPIGSEQWDRRPLPVQEDSFDRLYRKIEREHREAFPRGLRP